MLRNKAWLIWLGIITYLSNRPTSNLPKIQLLQFEGIDKVVHAIFYFVLVLLMNFSRFGRSSSFQNRRELLIVGFAISWGLLMELLQATVFTYRSAEGLDILANAFGALAAAAAFRYIYIHKQGS